MKFCLVSFLALTVFIQSCQSSRQKDPADILTDASKLNGINIANLNFQFELPPDWIRIDTTIQNVYICLLLIDDSSNNPRMNILNESMHGKSHSDYVSATQKNLSGVKVVDHGWLTMPNNNCLWYTYENWQAPIPRDITFYSIEANGISYNVTAATNPGGQKKYKDTFDRIVKSFSLQ